MSASMLMNPDFSRFMQEEDDCTVECPMLASAIWPWQHLHTPRHLTDRDEEILLALDRCPLTVDQLLKLSQHVRRPAVHEPPQRPGPSPKATPSRLGAQLAVRVRQPRGIT